MSALAWLFLTGTAAVLQVSTDWFRDGLGLAWLDAVLVLVLVLGAVAGPALGFLCGLVGGLIVGGPAGHPLETAILYGVGGALAERSGKTGIIALALLLTALLSPSWDRATLSLGCMNAVLTVGLRSLALYRGRWR